MNNLPVIEVEEIEVKPKTQWELRLEAEVSKSAKETWFDAEPKKQLQDIPWDYL